MEIAAIIAGGFYACAIILAVGGICFACVTRDRAYALFAAHALAVGGLALTFPPVAPVADAVAPAHIFWRIVAEGAVLTTVVTLIGHMVFGRLRSPAKIVLWAAFPALFVSVAASYYLTEQPVILALYGATSMIILLGILTTLAIRMAKGSKEAAMLAIAFAPLIGVGMLAATLEALSLLSLTFYAEGMLAGFGFELLFICTMLALRFRATLRERDQALVEAKRALEASETDALTGIANRRAFERELEQGIAGRFDAIAIMDCDFFKAINDDFGHAVGDEVLRAVGACLKDGDDFAARIGGEEFALLLRGKGWAARLETLRAHITLCISRDVPHLPVQVTFSTGAAALDSDIDPRTALLIADRALYSAKANGRNRLEIAGAHEAGIAIAA